MTDLLVELASIHPDLGTWAKDRRQAGWDDDAIRARLRTISLAARPADQGFDDGTDDHADAFAVTVLITSRMIADLFVTAIESGIDYWATSVRAANWEKSKSATSWWYDDVEYIGSERFKMTVEVEDDEKVYTVEGRAPIEKALAIIAQKYPRHLKDIIDDNHDAETADVFFQCLLFGEIVYG